MVLGQVDDPMDVSRVKGKDKGKGKGKGKNKDKGKTPWYDKGKGYGNSKGYGQSSDSKGKGKADKGKGKAKSSSKDMSSVVCHKCHKVGHYARDCWSKEKVRQVNETGGDNTQATPSAQPETSPTSPQSSKSVRRVALTFDLQDCETEFAENQSVRAVTCEQTWTVKIMDKVETILFPLLLPHLWSLDNYEVDFDDKHNLRRLGSLRWTPTSEMDKKKEQILGGKLFVRAVWTEEVSIILDSGSDATVLPYVYVETGKDTNNLSPLWDAQGQKIPTQGCREVQIGLRGEEAEHITIKDRGHISQHLSQPLISYGRFLKRGWCIGLENDFPKLVHGATGFPICLRPSLAFVNPSDEFSLEEWPYRTTIGYDGSTWEMLEFCEDMRMMDNLSERVDSKWQRLDILPPEQIVFATEGFVGHDQASSSAQAPVASQPVQQVQPEQADQGVQAEVPGAEVGGAVLPPHLELQSSRDVLEIGEVKVYPTSKGRPDQHKENAEKYTKRSLPCISFDLFYTSKKLKEPMEAVGEKDELNRLVCLAIVDSMTGAVSAVPLLNKGDSKMMAKEIVRWLTPFEVANGRPYVGKICEFAEPILAYVYTKPGPKGGARWGEAIFLGKTNSNDMFVFGIGNTLMLTRSIKKVFSDWGEKIYMYHELTVQSWMVEVLGNRMKKRVKTKPEAIGFPETASVPPTEDEEMNEEFLQVDFPDSMTLSELAGVPMPLTPRPMKQTPVPLPAPGSVVPPVRAEPAQQPDEATTEMVKPDAKRRRLAG
eukprot:s470_g12.t1